MKIGFHVFLAVAKELSFSEAAKQLHITPQCASDHIRRLEQEYQVMLFERKPHLSLTTAGKIMINSLQTINILENYMDKELSGVSRGERGSFTLGISTSRAPIILPHVLPRYYQEFPDVNISFSEEDTSLLEKRLISGEIDLFIGINTTPHPELQIRTLATEEIMLVISSRLLRQHFSSGEIEAMKNGIDLNRFAQVPFTLSFKGGKVNHVIQEYLNVYNLQLNVIYNISDSKTQIMLCTTGISATLCPRMLLSTAHQHNLSCNQWNYLHMFPVKNLGRQLRIDLVSRKNVVYPKFIQRFMGIMEEEVPAIIQMDLFNLPR